MKFVFGMISKYAEKNPQTHLSEIIQLMYSRSIKRLVKRQSQIFKELVEAAEELPQEMHKPFREFMKMQHKRLYEIPYNVDFNGKPFSYKIKKC